MKQRRSPGTEPPRKSGGRVLTDRSLVDEYFRKELSRRELLERTLLASAGALVGGTLLDACTSDERLPPGSDAARADAGSADAAGPDSGLPDAAAAGDAGADAAVSPPGHLVGMGWSTDHDTAVRAALAETIGLSFIRPGQSVYLKVNSNSGDPLPYSTNPDAVRVVGRMLMDAGAAEISVGDRSFFGDADTRGNLERNGIAQAARDIGATLYVFDAASVDWVSIPQTDAPDWAGGFRIPRPVVSADHIINLASMKTHFIAGATLALKLVIGLVNPDDRLRALSHEVPLLFELIAQANTRITPSMNVIDGHTALVSGGPTPTSGAPPTIVHPGLVIASTDRIAADATGVAVLKTLSPASESVTRTSVWNNPVIRAAIRHGLGITGPTMYDLSGPTVARAAGAPDDLDAYRRLVLAG